MRLLKIWFITKILSNLSYTAMNLADKTSKENSSGEILRLKLQKLSYFFADKIEEIL